jgi:hypothetical protein
MEGKAIFEKINPQVIRYIKLGRSGGLEQHCISNNICYLGFGTGEEIIFEQACRAAKHNTAEEWCKLWNIIYDSESDRDEQARKAAATLATNQIRCFYLAESETLWITFSSGKLYYAFLDPLIKPIRSRENGGSFRQVRGEWSCVDANRRELHIDRLSGQVTKTQLYRGTSCELLDGPREYLIRRINGEQHSYISKIEEAREILELGIQEAIRSLTPQDFEQLVDLIFSGSLRRVSSVGKVQKYVDIVYEDPLAGSGVANTICVQVKSKTTKKEFELYLDNPQRKTYDRFYYVYHQSDDLNESDYVNDMHDGAFMLLGAKGLSTLVVEAGLITWLVNKAG